MFLVMFVAVLIVVGLDMSWWWLAPIIPLFVFEFYLKVDENKAKLYTDNLVNEARTELSKIDDKISNLENMVDRIEEITRPLYEREKKQLALEREMESEERWNEMTTRVAQRERERESE